MPDPTTYVVAAVAVYGAGLSTYNVWQQRRDRKPDIEVKLSNGFGVYGSELGPACLFVQAVNNGSVPVTLSLHGLRLPGGQLVMNPNPPSDVAFPHELKPHTSCRAWFELKPLALDLSERAGLTGKVKLRGEYLDAAGEAYTSKPINFDVTDWSSRAANP